VVGRLSRQDLPRRRADDAAEVPNLLLQEGQHRFSGPQLGSARAELTLRFQGPWLRFSLLIGSTNQSFLRSRGADE
jgi:hypothetical protein